MTDLQTLLALAEDANAHLAGPEQAAWLGRLEAALPAFRLALQGCLDQGDALAGLRLSTALGRFWWMCGHAPEGRRWLEAFLAWPVSDDTSRARALAAAGGVAYAQADYVAARRFLDEAFHLAQLLDLRREMAGIVNQFGMVAREQGRLAEAHDLHVDAKGRYRDLADEAGQASCISNLGVVAYRQGDTQSACACHHDALARRRRLGDERGIASSLGSLANVARFEGDYATARAMHEEALAIRQRLGDNWGVAGSLVNLGAVAALAGDFAWADEQLTDAEAAFRAVGDALG